MKRIWFKILFVTIFLSSIVFYASYQKIYSTNVTNLKDSLSSAQLSYFARLGAGNTVGDSNIKIATAGNPYNTTDNLFVGDTLAIGNSAVGFTGSTIYIVRDIANTKTISLNAGLGASNTFTGAYIVATRSAIHTVTFKPQDSISGSKWQVLLKITSSSGETYNDGMPDQGGFDVKNIADSNITCPWGTASVGTTAVISGNSYQIFNCTLAAGTSNPINTDSTITIGTGASLVINPSASSGHILGNGDVYTIYLRNLDASDNVVSSTQGKIAINDNVLVTAVIDPTITFYIDSAGTSQPAGTRCGTTLAATADQTTSTGVNFGSLSLGQFNTLAQRFSCSTNATNGYTVQVFEDKPLTVTAIGSAITIPDTDCDVGSTCTTTTATSWSADNSTSQFGYSLEAVNSSPVAFSAGTNFTAKPFGIGYTNAQTIMSSSSTPTNVDRAYICYRITAANSQEAGTYQNQISFIATATF